MSKCIVHTLLSLCVSTFNEESLGNPQVRWIICVCVQGLHSIMDEQSKVLVNKIGLFFFDSPDFASYSDRDSDTPTTQTGVLETGM